MNKYQIPDLIENPICTSSEQITWGPTTSWGDLSASISSAQVNATFTTSFSSGRENNFPRYYPWPIEYLYNAELTSRGGSTPTTGAKTVIIFDEAVTFENFEVRSISRNSRESSHQS